MPEPEALWPLVLTAALVATSVPLRWSLRSARGRAAHARTRRRSSLALAVQAAYLGALILLAHDFDRVPPQASAYASIHFTLLAVHAAHVAAGMLLELWVLARLVERLTRYRLVALQVDRLLLVRRQRDDRRRASRCSSRRGYETAWPRDAAVVRPRSRRRSRGPPSSSRASTSRSPLRGRSRAVARRRGRSALTVAAVAVAIAGRGGGGRRLACDASTPTRRPTGRLHFFADAALLSETSSSSSRSCSTGSRPPRSGLCRQACRALAAAVLLALALAGAATRPRRATQLYATNCSRCHGSCRRRHRRRAAAARRPGAARAPTSTSAPATCRSRIPASSRAARDVALHRAADARARRLRRLARPRPAVPRVRPGRVQRRHAALRRPLRRLPPDRGAGRLRHRRRAPAARPGDADARSPRPCASGRT